MGVCKEIYIACALSRCRPSRLSSRRCEVEMKSRQRAKTDASCVRKFDAADSLQARNTKAQIERPEPSATRFAFCCRLVTIPMLWMLWALRQHNAVCPRVFSCDIPLGSAAYVRRQLASSSATIFAFSTLKPPQLTQSQSASS